MAELWKNAWSAPIGPSRTAGVVTAKARKWSTTSCGDIDSTVEHPCDPVVCRVGLWFLIDGIQPTWRAGVMRFTLCVDEQAADQAIGVNDLFDVVHRARRTDPGKGTPKVPDDS